MLKLITALFTLTLITKILQILSFCLMASIFGTTVQIESFFVALSFPLLITIISSGCFGIIFVLTFTNEKIKSGERSAWEFANSFINTTVLFTLGIAILYFITAPLFIHQIAPMREQIYNYLSIRLTRLLLISVISSTFNIIITAILQSYRMFILPAVAILISNLLFIGALSLAGQKMDLDLLVNGFIFSGLSATALLLIGSRKLWKARYNFKINLHHPAFKEALGMVSPVILINILGQAIFTLNRFFVSFLPVGNIAILEYATKAASFIPEVIALSLALPFYQRMSSEMANGDKAKLRQTFMSAIKTTAVILLPLVAFTVFWRQEIFSLLFRHGRFTLQAVREVSMVFFNLSLLMIGGGFAQIVTNTFLAMKKSRLLLLLCLAAVTLHICLNVFLLNPLGVKGIALASGITTFIGIISAIRFISRELGGFEWNYFARFILKLFLASVLATSLGRYLFSSPESLIKIGTLMPIAKIIISGLINVGAFIFLSHLFKIQEIRLALSKITVYSSAQKRLKR